MNLFKRNYLGQTALIVLLGLSLTMSSCLKESGISPGASGEGMESLKISDSFNFNAMQKVSVKIYVLSNDDKALAGVPVFLCDEEPSEKTARELSFAGGKTNAEGIYETTIIVSGNLEEIFVCPEYIGVSDMQIAKIEKGEVEITIGGKQIINKSAAGISEKTLKYPAITPYDSKGIPTELAGVDIIDYNFLQRLNLALPERTDNSKWTDNKANGNLYLKEDAEQIYMTFLDEGAGYHNCLGYYTYDKTSSAAEQAQSIEDTKRIAFPNTSKEAGYLPTGARVQLKYYGNDSINGETTFPANTVIGWIQVSQGWKKAPNGYITHYSDYTLNTTEKIQAHTVIFRDDFNVDCGLCNGRVVVAFEDISRDSRGCDHDFNDCIFYASVYPNNAIDDGVADIPQPGNPSFFPDAYINEYCGGLGFEDLWPSKGDYDFNDLVLDYAFMLHTSSNSLVYKVGGEFTVNAIGAGFHNGFGIELNIPSSKVATPVTDSRVDLSGPKVVVYLFEDAFDILTHPGNGATFVNTVEGEPTVEPVTVKFEFDIKEEEPTRISEFFTTNAIAFNPFLTKNGERNTEIHLPGMAVTSGADQSSWAGIGADADNKWFKTETNLPWAIHVPYPFKYMEEKVDINLAYPDFKTWAESNGKLKKNWYMNYNSRVYEK